MGERLLWEEARRYIMFRGGSTQPFPLMWGFLFKGVLRSAAAVLERSSVCKEKKERKLDLP